MVTLAAVASIAIFAMTAAPQETAQAVYAKVAPSVLLVVAQGPDGKIIAQGSGFVIESNLIVTNAHVVKGGTPAVMTGVATIPCTLIRFDERNDLAVLRPSATMSVPALRAANPNTPIGTRVFAIGNPQGLERTITEGIYSGPRQMNSSTLLQISAPISPGSSGGPVVDSNGLVIGVAVGSLETGQNLNFAVPVDTLITLLAQPETGAARPIGAAPAPSVPVAPPVAAAPPPLPVAPAAGSNRSTADHLRDFDAVLKERLAIRITPATEARWTELHSREEKLLIAAVSAAATDEEFRAVHMASVPNQHDSIGLYAAKEAMRRAPAPKAWHHLGVAWAAFGYSGVNDEPKKSELLQEARAAVLKGLPLDASSWSWLLSGRIHLALREWGTAKAAYNLANSTGPHADDRPEIARGLWRSHSGLNENADADRWFAEYSKTGFVSDSDWFDRANHIASSGRYSEGATIVAKLAGDREQLTGRAAYDLWYWVTFAHWKAREDKAALNAAAETMRSAPGTPDGRRTGAMAATIAASIQAEAGDYTGAQESVNFAIGADPAFPAAYTQQAKIHLAARRFAEAEREARRTLSLVTGPESEAHYVLGQILGAQNRWAEAAQSFTTAATADAANPYPAFNAAISFENAGRLADALRWYEETLRRNPTSAERDRIVAVIAKLKGGG